MKAARCFSGALCILALLSSSSVSAYSRHVPHPHLDPEMSGAEYRAILDQIDQQNEILSRAGLPTEGVPDVDPENAAIEQYLLWGKRNLDWVNHINAHRPEGQKLSLTSPATQNGYPVSQPSTYNFTIIRDRWEILRALLPVSLASVVFDGAPMTDQPPVSDREFIEWMAQVDGAYQRSARYRLMKPRLEFLKAAAMYDVRGYLLFSQIDIDVLETQLASWDRLPVATQGRFARALVQICRNNEKSQGECRAELEKAIAGKSVGEFKSRMWPGAIQNFRSFFDISLSRSDVSWSAESPELATVPFTRPRDERVLEFLRTNIEEEWKWGQWQLRLGFVETSSPNITHVRFVPGATPHVNGLAGSEITMDNNAPLSEYDVRWTIRHEYGHVLGLPDCYHEFYDEEQEVYLSYQLDVTNLMCSRRGKLQARHFDELKRVYFRGE